MTALAADPSGLLAGIVACPDDWQARLVYADWLDEQNEPERAEFLRLQVRIAQLRQHCSCGACVRLRGGGQHTNGPCVITQRDDDGVKPRECEVLLLTAHEERWRSAGPCETCGGSGDDGGHVYDRGMVGVCQKCGGTGYQGPLLQKFQYRSEVNSGMTPELPVRIDWSRYPLLTVRVPRLSDGVETCPDCVARPSVGCLHCSGKVYVPTPWLRAVVAHHPGVIGVEPMCRIPAKASGGPGEWYRDSGRGRVGETSYHLPDCLFDRLQGGELFATSKESTSGVVHQCFVYPSTTDATTALGRAIVQFAREYKI